MSKKAGLALACAAVFGITAGTSFHMIPAFENVINTEQTETKHTTLEPETKENVEKVELQEGSAKNSVTTSAGDTTNTVADVAQIALPSIVAITSVSIQEIPDYFSQYFGYGDDTKQYPTTGSGSGIIVGENDTELLIATNQHVVADASTISVCFMGSDVVSAEEETTKLASGNGDLDLENAVTGQIKGEDSINDVAVVAVLKDDIPEETLKQIRIAQLGDSDQLVVGEQVVAIGNALGIGQSLTSGYVSALNRNLSVDDGSVCENLIQTDAAINPGNSGGALLNMKGEVIGINVAKQALTEVEGMGYAISISNVKDTLESLMNRKTRSKVEDEEKASYIGVSVLDVTSEMIQVYDLPQGAYVKEVTADGPAEKAGIKKGDIIASLDGNTIAGKDQLVNLVKYYEAGETVSITVYRSDAGEYTEQELEITFGKRADSDLADSNSTDSDSGNMEELPDINGDDQEDDQEDNREEIPDIQEFFEYFR